MAGGLTSLRGQDSDIWNTFAYYKHLLLQLVGATIEDVSIKERVSCDAVLDVLKRRCYSIFNLKHLFQSIYLDLEGFRLFD